VLRPPTLAGPYIPVAAGAPPLADPAPGALVADPDAPPADPPPAEPPPADPPPPPPPPLCAKVDIGERRTAARSNLHGNEMDIGKLLFSPTPWKTPRSKAGTNLRGAGRAVSRPAGSFDRHSGATGLSPCCLRPRRGRSDRQGRPPRSKSLDAHRCCLCGPACSH
jgi:hypothetical protein